MTRKKEILKSKNLGIYIEKYYRKDDNQGKQGLTIIIFLATILSLSILYSIAMALDYF
jgi:hypothetical protein